ncbi:ribonuclease HII [Methanocaldococcus villosus KIN24-T80]|uniref:Ribonuclease n=1 Tax=Methanocaldococcus villosus KIN24-T80 TaxID=1069083 RepID=N6VYQ2_9EURY|nr:ribonuclease HII [Methanocaldococcus villosus KIN24-T80]
MILGIDEAGRGCVIGPLVICGYATDEEKLKNIGVKDSKKLNKKERERLKNILESIGYYDVIIITPEELNKMMNKKNLNDIEIEAFKEIIKKFINKFEIEKVYIDACSSNLLSFKRKFKDLDIEIIAEHKADDKYLRCLSSLYNS